ncbi:NAD(P)H-dependent oxidoreductase [Sulfurimonas sp. MAG313]|nr:NAD(P)H-dependent oxidoreductase [Sulfurimonas sp. MAG313]MDF1881980.1 NAD(P)H-dependent oxidoreductase [Sulfurimonas sp. MAG313]
MKKIAIIVSSVQKNMELARKLETEAKEQGAQVEFINLVELALPMYTSVLEDEKGIPSEVHELTQRLIDCDSYIMVAPEYNGSLPPVLSNAIAWVSRTGDNFRAVFNQKFVALASHSGGGGAKLMESMRIMFVYLGANVLSREIINNYTKEYNPKTAKSVVEELLRY